MYKALSFQMNGGSGIAEVIIICIADLEPKMRNHSLIEEQLRG
jgi:hypothetical protein